MANLVDLHSFSTAFLIENQNPYFTLIPAHSKNHLHSTVLLTDVLYLFGFIMSWFVGLFVAGSSSPNRLINEREFHKSFPRLPL